MKSFVSTLAVIFASRAHLAVATDVAVDAGSSGSNLDQCYPSVPDYKYNGKEYWFSRMKYNSVCTDSNGKQYQWGKMEGFYPGSEGVCSKACISGHPSYDARGCTDRKINKLVGFNYNCDEAACYCLYEKGTWSGSYSPCFDSINTSNQGQGDVSGTTVNPGSTCYRLEQVQPVPSPPTKPPTRPPTQKRGGICTGTPDYKCYKHNGRPACCQNGESTCPNFYTMCDNHEEGVTGWSYCTHSPDFSCYPNTHGQPECCSKPGGDVMNCPKNKPPCGKEAATAYGIGEDDIMKFLRGTN